MEEPPKTISKLRIGSTEYDLADADARVKIPTRTSELTNDSDFTSLSRSEYQTLAQLLEDTVGK